MSDTAACVKYASQEVEQLNNIVKPQERPKKQQQKKNTTVITSKPYTSLPKISLIDIGANLTTDFYFKKRKYINGETGDDFIHVLSRSLNTGVRRLMITGVDLESTKEALNLVKKYPGILATTVGFHPTHTNSLASYEDQGQLDQIIAEIREIATAGAKDGTIVAIGECGYDFNIDRLKFSDEATQRKYFPLHLELAIETGLPLFLHNRESNEAFFETLSLYADRLTSICVHSYDGGVEFLEQLLSLPCNVYIGLNGCSLRTEEGLEVAKAVPVDRLLIETDAPYCAIKRTHPSHKYIKSHWLTKKSDKYIPQLETLFDHVIDDMKKCGDVAMSQGLKQLNDDIHDFISRQQSLLPSPSSTIAGNDEQTIRDVAVASPYNDDSYDDRLLPTLLDGRVEPCHVLQVLEVIAGVRDIDINELGEQIYQNTLKCFYSKVNQN